MRKVAVIFGGKSCENEISVLTGVFVLNVLGREKYDVTPVYLDTDGKAYTSPEMYNLDVFKRGDVTLLKRVFFEDGYLWELKEKGTGGKVKKLVKVDCAFNCCHGGLGEGGGVSALMEMNGIPLASPSVLPSAVFLDKAASKLIAAALNIPTVDYIRVQENDYKKRGRFLLRSIGSRLKYPVVIKPARLGSSIGITLAKNEDEVKSGLDAAFLLDDKVIIEKFLEDKADVNCAAYKANGEIFVSDVEVASSKDGIYTFSEKYLKSGESAKGGGRVGNNSRLDGDVVKKIKSYTKTLYKRMDLNGVVRVDYLVKGKEVYLSEVNTVPGSLAYYLFCERVTDAREFFFALIEEGISQKNEKGVLGTGILQKVRLNGKVRL